MIRELVLILLSPFVLPLSAHPWYPAGSACRCGWLWSSLSGWADFPSNFVPFGLHRGTQSTQESMVCLLLKAGVRRYDQSEPIVSLESCPCCVLSRRQLLYDKNTPQHRRQERIWLDVVPLMFKVSQSTAHMMHQIVVVFCICR